MKKSPKSHLSPLPTSKLFAGLLLALMAFLLHDAIESRSILYDEGITLLITSGHSQPEWPEGVVSAGELRREFDHHADFRQLVGNSFRDVHPPLYYVVAATWRRWIGSSLESLRWFSAICVLVQAGLVFWFVSRLPVPGLAAGIYCVAALAIGTGALARGYALASLAVLVALAATARPATRFTALVAGTACSVALATHYFAAFSVAGIGAVWVLRFRQSRSRLALLPPSAIVLSGLVLCPFLIRAATSRPHQFAGFEGLWAESVALVWALMGGLARRPEGLDHAVALTGLVLLGAALVAGLLRSCARSSRDDRLICASVATVANAVGLLAVFAAADKTLTESDAIRYAGLTLPALAIVIGYGVDLLPSRWSRVCFVVMILFEGSQYRWGGDFEGATARKIAAGITPGRTAVVGAGYGRGVPASMVYELPAATPVCVLRFENNCREGLDGALLIRSVVAPGSPIFHLEQEFARSCPRCDVQPFENQPSP